jgi:hypothetical protein
MRQLLEPISPSENFVPVLSLRRRLDALVREFQLSLQHGEDDLDSYDAALLETEGGNRFLLFRYRNSPADMVDIYIPAHLLGRGYLLNEIVAGLRIPKSAIIHHRRSRE